MKHLCLLLLLIAACTQPTRPTPTIRPVGETPTAVPPATITPSPTDTATFTPSASPTVTLTPAPTWTPWIVFMDFSPDENVILDPKNPVQNCIITYFDLTLEPGIINVWRRDNGGYITCTQAIQ